MQGTVLTMAKASGAAKVVVWNGSLKDLRACSASMVHRSTVELVESGYLVELPGHRMVNGRLFSSWMAPVELDEKSLTEHGSISVFAPEHGSISAHAAHFSDSAASREHGSISVLARKPSITPRVRARGTVHHHQSITTTNNDFPETDPSSKTSDDCVNPSAPADPNQRYSLAEAGLRWAKYREPEQALKRFGVERCLVAVQALTRKYEANEFVAKPGGFVFTTLLMLADVEVAPVSDVGFARWWDESALPSNVRVMR